MADIVNLRRARKNMQRDMREKEAAANRTLFGRTRAEKEAEAAKRALAEKAIAAHKRERN